MDFTISCLNQAKESIEGLIESRNKYQELRIKSGLKDEIQDNFEDKTELLESALSLINYVISDINEFNAE